MCIEKLPKMKKITRFKNAHISLKFDMRNWHSRDRIVVSTLRCGRNNPGSNPGHGTF